MEPDTTTPESLPEAVQAPERGKLLRFGLNTGQTVLVLTKKPVQQDLDMLVIYSANGDVVTIKNAAVSWTRSSEIDMPTEAEIAAYEAALASPVVAPAKAESSGIYL